MLCVVCVSREELQQREVLRRLYNDSKRQRAAQIVQVQQTSPPPPFDLIPSTTNRFSQSIAKFYMSFICVPI